MAVKARAEITLSSIRDVQSVTRYYLLQSSTSAVPSKPTTNPPGGNWVTSEPTYTSGSTNSLYFTDCTVFSDDTFVYSDVSLSSSYEAAKVAYNKAENAESIVDNLQIGGRNLIRRTDYSIYGNSNNYNHSDRATFSSDRVTIPFNNEVYHREYTKNTIKTPVPAGTKIIISVYVYEQTVPDGNHRLYVAGLRSTGSVYWSDTYKAIPYGFVGKFTWVNTTPEDFYGFVLDFDTRNGTSGQMVLGPVKAETGNIPTDWTPALEDIESDISAANALAQSAKDTADGKITTFYAASTATPTATTVGDLWIKTDDGNSLWRWNGTSWVSVDNADIQSALTAAGTAQATADSKVVTFAQTSMPTATDVGDIWIDTDDSNHLYRWDGEDWVDVHDPQIDAANEKIENLEVGGRNLIKNTLYPSATAAKRPRLIGQIANTSGRGTASVAEHGVKFTTTNANWQYIHFGLSSNSAAVDMLGLEPGETYTLSADLSWKVLSSATGKANATTYYMGATLYYSTVESGSFSALNSINQFPITQADKGTHMSGRLVYTFTVPMTAKRLYLGIKCSLTTASHYANGDYIEARNLKLEKGSKASAWTPAPEDLEEAITASQETADGKNTVYYQADAPSGGTYKTNDIWFDTDDDNKMYRWNGSAWTAAPFGNAAFSNIDAGKVTTGTMSAARIKGDILTLGGANNADGILQVYDANGNLVGSFTREGLMAIAGIIGGWTIGDDELTGEWEQNYRHYESRFTPNDGLQFEQTSTEPGYDSAFLNQIFYGLTGLSFLQRRTVNNAIQQTAAFITADINSGWNGSDPEGQITISPHLHVDGTGIDTTHMRSDAQYAKTLVDGSYIRQPAMIMSGSTTISTGTYSKRATICTIPVEYQTGWRIIPFVTRTYGTAGATPEDAGDFYYAYYNSADHKVCVKLANVLASGIAYTFDYMIYAVPTT